MTGQSGSTVKWYYAFTEGDRGTFWSKVTKKGFSHVVVFSQTGKVVTAIEPLPTGISITAYHNMEDFDAGLHEKDAALQFLLAGFKVVEHEFIVYDNQSIVHIANLYPSCVSVAKAITGYRSWAHTPYQLYQCLLLNGGNELKIEDFQMGGLFSKPKAPKVPDNKKQLEALERERKQAEAERINNEEALRREKDLRGRRDRGRMGLIATSETGTGGSSRTG